MGQGDVDVSFQGLGQLIAGSRDQHGHLRTAVVLADSRLDHPEAFGGAFAIFRGTYADAVRQVVDGLLQARDAAEEFAEGMASARAQYRTSEAGVDRLHTSIETSVLAMPMAQLDTSSDIDVMPFLTAGSGADATLRSIVDGNAADNRLDRAVKLIPDGPGTLVDAADTMVKLSGHADQIRDNRDTLDDINEFLEGEER